ncbi:MAG: hypothetical protein ACI91Z_000989 [Yoonia sp.]|jgi:hypothetical protein
MTEAQLIAKLKLAWHQAGEKKVALSIHLFGIDFAHQLKGHRIEDICIGAEVPKSYGTEIRKGIRLSEFVERKECPPNSPSQPSSHTSNSH